MLASPRSASSSQDEGDLVGRRVVGVDQQGDAGLGSMPTHASGRRVVGSGFAPAARPDARCASTPSTGGSIPASRSATSARRWRWWPSACRSTPSPDPPPPSVSSGSSPSCRSSGSGSTAGRSPTTTTAGSSRSAAQGVSWVTSILCALQAFLGNTNVWVLYALVALWNGAFAVASPSRSSIYPRILEARPAARRQRAVGLRDERLADGRAAAGRRLRRLGRVPHRLRGGRGHHHGCAVGTLASPGRCRPNPTTTRQRRPDRVCARSSTASGS